MSKNLLMILGVVFIVSGLLGLFMKDTLEMPVWHVWTNLILGVLVLYLPTTEKK